MTSTSASSGSSSHRRSYTRPDVTWLSRWLSNFPLHTYPEDPSSTSPNASPTSLYVVPPHPGPSSWTSADPRCLRWQIEFLFRSASSRSSAPINLVFLDPRTEDFVWGPGGQLPFLEVNDDKLTSSKQQSSLIGISGLQHWVDNYMPYPWDRPELQEKAEAGSSKPYPTQALKFEAESWVTLLEIKVTSGVLMQLLTLPTTATPPRQRPALLTRLLASNLLPSALYRLSLLRNLSYLVPFHPTAHPSPLPTFLSWLGAIEFTHPFSLPGGGSTEKNEAEWLGKSEKEREEDLGDRAQSGDWRSARSERDEARILELALAEGSGSYVDIITAACEALEAVGSRLEADGDGAESGWILGAE
ncbi:hypothetical protein OC846_000296 [Tilletia horrida]|uniref:Uncharacterized protein n=1 Tax=Tilletia horrida TaxID=155126 RepID=A0AAN6GUR5_9BASI|nr:hypothetical protein OC846_000296 [Tilletia horrida]KAK0570296.1 hypothetical protein OC861_000039 [Tilletia horrida]